MVSKMISVLPALALLVHSVAAIPASSSRVTKRDSYSDVVWQGSGPMGVGNGNSFDAREPGIKGGNWFHLQNGGTAAGLNPGGMVGWRLRTDYSNGVVFKLTDLTNTPLLAAAYNGSADNAPAGIQNFATVGQANFKSSTSSATSGDIWTNTTGYQELGWSVSVDVDNGCTDTKTFIITTVDANGATNTINGVNYIPGIIMPTALPVNLTITTQENPEDIITITYFDVKGLTYKLGSGLVEPSIPPSSIYTDVFWCDAD